MHVPRSERPPFIELTGFFTGIYGMFDKGEALTCR